MLIGTGRPSGITWTVSGTGVAILTDADALTNGRPTSTTALQWLSGAQTTTSTVHLRGVWSGAIQPRVVGIIGCTLPAGTMIRVTGSSNGGTSWAVDLDPAVTGADQQRLTRLPSGQKVAWFYLPTGITPINGLQISLVNDVDGNATITADTEFEIGEVWVSDAFDLRVRRDIALGVVDPTAADRSYIAAQGFAVPRTEYRTLTVQVTPQNHADTLGSTGTDIDSLRHALARRARCAVIPMRGAPGRGRGSVEQPETIQRTAFFGWASDLGAIRMVDNANLYAMTLTLEEIPASAE